jgi:hypothetical protein
MSPRPAATPHPDQADWSDVILYFEEEHRQGEHVAVCGVNGSGKTLLLLELAKVRASRVAKDGRPSRVVVLVTKPRDDTVDEQLQGWPHITRWPPEYGQEHVIVWPTYKDPHTVRQRQAKVFGPLLRTIFAEGGQTVVIDEVATFSDPPPEGLGLRALISHYYSDARSNKLTMMGATQRPSHVPRSMWSESDWLVIFALYDHDDLRRIREIGGNTQAILDAVADLDEHECLFIHRRGSRLEMLTTQVELQR